MLTIGIIGAGASGIAAALRIKKEDPAAKVLLFDHMKIVGKKLLVTGNGRCNLMNLYLDETCYRGTHPEFASEVLGIFGISETKAFLQETGIILKDRDGYVYPRSDSAASVRDLLEGELRRRGVELCLETEVTDIRRKKGGFLLCFKSRVSGQTGDCVCEKVILACGGKAAEKQGSDGSGHRLAERLGHTIIPPLPALTALHVKNHPLKQAKGVRTRAAVSLFCDGYFVTSDEGELQITDYGISGIPVFQISSFASRALFTHRKVEVKLDILPEMTFDEALTFFMNRMQGMQGGVLKNLFETIFQEKLLLSILQIAKLDQKKPLKSVSEADLRFLIKICKSLRLQITSTNGFADAQVCSGGVSTEEVEAKTMESRLAKGLYLTGELLDIDGICGGYNLQWAWATGNLAGAAAGRKA